MHFSKHVPFFLSTLICVSLFVGGCGGTDENNSSSAAAGTQRPAAVSVSDSAEGSAEKEDSPGENASTNNEDSSEKTDSAEKKDSPEQDTPAEKDNSSEKTDSLESTEEGTASSGQAASSKDGENPDGSASAKSGSTATESVAKDTAKENSADNSSAESAASNLAAAEPRMLKYIDAWQEWHVMEVDSSVSENIYDPDSWIVQPDGRTTLKDARYEVLQGVDVSEHQGYIDWEAVAQAGFRFAFIRVGYRGYGEAGTMFEDATAVENLRNAKAAGLQVGTYVFSQALNEEEAREEAAVSLGVINASGIKPDLPLMYDPELIKDDVGRANGITREQVSLNTAAFRDEVERHSDVKVDIYSNLPWEHNYFDADTMNQYEIWYADYEKIPQTPYHFVWWQYTNEGYVPGIEGRVDLDLWVRPVEAAE